MQDSSQWFDFDEELDKEAEECLLHAHLQDDPYATQLLSQLKHLNRNQHASIDIVLVMKALYYVRMMHQAQTHYSGASLYTHVVDVASMVANYQGNTEAIVTTLFHAIEEKPNFTLGMIEDEFGRVITEKVAAFTTPLVHEDPVFKALDYQPCVDTDVRTIQLCKQLYEMRTVDCLEPEVQQQKAAATIQEFVILAAQLGFTAIEQELNKLCYQVLCPHKSLPLLPQYASDAMAVLSLAFQSPTPSNPINFWNIKPELND